MNEWNEARCLKWLKVRLTGRAQIAFQRLPPEIRDSYDEATEALKEGLNQVAGKHDIRRNF